MTDDFPIIRQLERDCYSRGLSIAPFPPFALREQSRAVFIVEGVGVILPCRQMTVNMKLTGIETNDIEQFQQSIDAYSRNSQIRDGIDFILDTINNYLWDSDFECCKRILNTVTISDEIPDEFAIALLSATLPVRDKLMPERDQFYGRVKSHLERTRGERETRKLLVGLQ
jgi:hypothetical protein